MHRLICLSVCALSLIPSIARADSPPYPQPRIAHHQLTVALSPETHALHAVDDVTLQVGAVGHEIAFSLAATLTLDRVEDMTDCATGRDHPPTVTFARRAADGASVASLVVVTLPRATSLDRPVRLKFVYHGTIDDPPRDPRHLRFVTPSDTSGHIGPEGIYLSSESEWYPDLDESLATYDATITVPVGWTAVTQGSPQEPANGSVRWVVPTQSEALTLTANRFVVKTREWRAQSGQSIQLATYLFPDEAGLADEYLDAAARYLDAYIPLLGPYPFARFAVVENFFSSGLGMPSFTLLGSGVIKRHYTQPYALGHEIVHSWIGNGVFNRVSRGNWVEGLTTYLSNYYYHELTGETAQAREQRRLMLLGYSVYVRPGEEYPVRAFAQKHNEADNAIGYQQAAMVFHLLRQAIGDAAFWWAVKQIPEQYLGRVADWDDLQRTFEAAAGRDLGWFFAQWVERGGAPDLALSELRVHPATTHQDGMQTVEASVRLVQRGRTYRLPVELEFLFADGRSQRRTVQLTEAQQDVTVELPARPTAVRLDPDVQLFRRLARTDMAPMLNLYVTDRARTILAPPSASAGQPDPFTDIVQRIEAQEAAKPPAERTTVLRANHKAGVPSSGSVLILSDPRTNPSAAEAFRSCGDHVQLTEQGFTVAGQRYEGPTMALLVSCRRADVPGSVVTILYGVTPQALVRPARLLFFYGWQSYVVFQDGAVIQRGDWDDRMSPEVRSDAESS